MLRVDPKTLVIQHEYVDAISGRTLTVAGGTLRTGSIDSITAAKSSVSKLVRSAYRTSDLTDRLWWEQLTDLIESVWKTVAPPVRWDTGHDSGPTSKRRVSAVGVRENVASSGPSGSSSFGTNVVVTTSS